MKNSKIKSYIGMVGNSIGTPAILTGNLTITALELMNKGVDEYDH